MVNFLWDTGAQVSILSSTWLIEHFQGKEVLPLEELFYHKIAIKAASGDNIPFEGCVHSRDMKTQHIKFEILNERLTLFKCNLIQFNFVLNMLVIGRICNEIFICLVTT